MAKNSSRAAGFLANTLCTFLHGLHEALTKSAGPRFVSSGPAFSLSIALRSKID
jgi:hypothetical protein